MTQPFFYLTKFDSIYRYIHEKSPYLSVSKLIFMKKLIVISFAALFLAACGGSKKGAWSDEDKEKARKEMEKGIRESGVDPKIMKEFIDCAIKKFEENYENFEEADNASDQEGEKIVSDCTASLMKDALKDVKIPETPAVNEEPAENPAAEEEMPADEM